MCDGGLTGGTVAIGGRSAVDPDNGGFGGLTFDLRGRLLFADTCGSIGGGTGDTIPGETGPLPGPGCGDVQAESAFTGGGNISRKVPFAPKPLPPVAPLPPTPELVPPPPVGVDATVILPAEGSAGAGDDDANPVDPAVGDGNQPPPVECEGDKNCCENELGACVRVHDDDVDPLPPAEAPVAPVEGGVRVRWRL